MKEQFVKWLPVIALACFVAAVFLIADDTFGTVLCLSVPERALILPW